jgi:hypothetical protein
MSIVADLSLQTMELRRQLAGRVDDPPSLSGGRVVQCGFRHLAPLDGVISFLARECGGNPHDRGVITVLASSSSDRFPPRLLVDPNLARRWCSHPSKIPWCSDQNSEQWFSRQSADQCFSLGSRDRRRSQWTVDQLLWTRIEDQWFSINFKAMSVAPTRYSIRSCCDNNDEYGALQWRVDGRRHGSADWILLDQRTFDIDSEERPRGTAVTCTFPVAATGQFQVIKVTNIGFNSSGDNSFTLSFFELFGTLTIPEDE